MKIVDFDKLKFTSIKYGGDIIHFKYNNENYVLQNGGTEMTLVIKLFKGRTKYKLDCVSSNYGMVRDLIKYKNNKKVLSYIDKWNFVKELIKAEILEPSEEQGKIIKYEKMEELNNKKMEIQKEIDNLLGSDK